jgi:hypothetical protein
MPEKPTESLLLVGAATTIPEALRGVLPLPWLQTASAKPRATEPLAKNVAAQSDMPTGSAADNARARWAQRLQTERGSDSDTLIGKLLMSLTSKASARQPTSPVETETQPAAAEQREATASLVAVRSPFRADRQVTVLTAETSAALVEATDRLLAPAIWNRLEGDYARWHGASAAPITQRLDERFMIGRLESDPGQLRLVALTFLSSQRSMWIGLLLASLVLLSIGTSWALRRPRQQ